MAGHGLRSVALAATALFMLALPAGAASWLEKNFWLSGPRYDAVLPPCEDGGALGTIQANFASKEGRFWNSSLAILDFEGVREVATMPWNRGARDAIPRRFCRAVALVSDGRKRPVYYSIIEDGGLIGASFGVHWCVVGLDRNWANNPRCRMALP
jgi:hypothetical protein